MLDSKFNEGKPNLAVIVPINKRTKKMAMKSENEDLNLHVRLCAERYSNLETRLDGLNTRITKLEDGVSSLKTQITTNFNDIKMSIENNNNKRNTQFIISAGTIVVAIISAIGLYLSKH